MPSRPWLPPSALIGSQVALGLSWALLGVLAARGELTFSLPTLAWVHLVALGWLSLTALAILFHVIPGFLDTPVRPEDSAREMLWVYMGGTALLVAGFWGQQRVWIAWGGVATAVGLVGVGGPLAGAVAVFAVARRRKAAGPTPFVLAFFAVFTALALTIGLGLAMAGSLAGWWSTAALALAPAHAHLAAGGWLSLLVMGVSMRTLVRITGVRRTRPLLHAVGSTGFLAGVAVLALSLAAGITPLEVFGASLCALAGLAYILDAGQLVLRSRDPHVPPRAFLGCGLGYLTAAIALGLLVLAGRSNLAPAYVYVALVGWLGQMVSGHIHHIGVRFLVTWIRGEEDETEPIEVLFAPLSWTTWAAAQAAVVIGAAGLILGASPLVETAAACGLLGWLAQILNGFWAARAARR